MNVAARVSLAVLVAVLVVLGMLRERDDLQVSRTSFGTVPPGYRGAHDVLAALDLPVTRGFAPPARLEPDATVWWLEPEGLCGERPTGTAADGAPPSMAAAEWPGRAWIEAGGVAVVMLPQAAPRCPSVAGLELPARVEVAAPAEPTPAATDAERRRLGWLGADRPAIEQAIDGPLQARTVQGVGLTTFADGGAWRVRARVEGRPFLLERDLGRGRLVVVADPAPIQNAWLGAADAAPWLADLVRAFGVPRLDEYAHGLRAEGSAARFLARSPAAGLFLGLAVLGGLVAWRGGMLPPRAAGPDPATAAPVLEPFVDALAALYARSRDYDRVARRYRELAVARLGRHLGLPPGTTHTALLERLQAVRPRAAAEARRLLEPGPVRSERELRAVARAIDDLMREVGA